MILGCWVCGGGRAYPPPPGEWGEGGGEWGGGVSGGEGRCGSIGD